MSILISAQSISKTYGVEPLFTDLDFKIFQNEKIGIIGPNGSGKSTLLKIFQGIELPDEGKVIPNLNMKRVYLPQNENFALEKTIQEILFNQKSNQIDQNAVNYFHEIRQVAGEDLFLDLNQKVNILSGGWRKRLSILAALLQKPDLLLMDEPTNHLDLEGIIWLENLLKKATFSFIVISHDRLFLENIVTSIIELNPNYLEGYLKVEGGYNHFLKQKIDILDNQQKKEQALANRFRREQEWLRRGPKARTTKAQYRIDQADQLAEDLRRIRASNTRQQRAAIDFSETQRKTKNLLLTHQLEMSRGSKLLFRNLNLKLSPGSCLGLIGGNGSGKSTLISILNGNLKPDAGKIEYASNLKIVIFDQERKHFNQQVTLKQALAPEGDSVFYQGNSIHVAAWAKKFLFPPDQLNQPVSKLSGGEQARVLIANLVLQPADILLLDEPTNDLDIPTLEILEESLAEFGGAIVLITHDRFLMQHLCNQILYLDGEGNCDFFADYDQLQQFKKLKSSKKEISGNKPKKISYEEQRELNKLPAKIEKIENEMQGLQQQLETFDLVANPERVNEICLKIKEVQEKLDSLYKRWEELDSNSG